MAHSPSNGKSSSLSRDLFLGGLFGHCQLFFTHVLFSGNIKECGVGATVGGDAAALLLQEVSPPLLCLFPPLAGCVCVEADTDTLSLLSHRGSLHLTLQLVRAPWGASAANVASSLTPSSRGTSPFFTLHIVFNRLTLCLAVPQGRLKTATFTFCEIHQHQRPFRPCSGAVAVALSPRLTSLLFRLHCASRIRNADTHTFFWGKPHRHMCKRSSS